MKRNGRCLCGEVKYEATGVGAKLSACHCAMCRRWAGGPFFSASAKGVSWQGEESLRTYTSSDWAERGFCAVCGSGIFYRITAPGPHHGVLSLAFGTLDDPTGFELGREWFIDQKPDAYGLAGDQEAVTEAEALAMLGSI